VQIDPIKPKLKPPGTQRLKLEHDGLLSNFGFRCNLSRYIEEGEGAGADIKPAAAAAAAGQDVFPGRETLKRRLLLLLDKLANPPVVKAKVVKEPKPVKVRKPTKAGGLWRAVTLSRRTESAHMYEHSSEGKSRSDRRFNVCSQ
jgi:hypothetical protein